jgi:hydrogenase maturation protease
MKTLLVGMGNPILSDDAVGVRLAKDFARRLGSRPGLDVVEECSVGGLNLVDVFRGYERAIVLDSVRTAGGLPGQWHHFDARALETTRHLENVHDVNFSTALDLGRRLGVPLPGDRDIHIFAVEVVDNQTFSERMTQALEESYPVYSAEIFRSAEGLLASAN